MKKIQSMMLMLLVVVMGMTVVSCEEKEETKIIGGGVVTYYRESFTTTLKFKDVLCEEYQNPMVLAQLTQDELLVFNTFGASVSEADNRMKNLDSSNATDSNVLNIYKSYLKEYQSGKGFEGYIQITKSTNGGSETEVGRITFTK